MRVQVIERECVYLEKNVSIVIMTIIQSDNKINISLSFTLSTTADIVELTTNHPKGMIHEQYLYGGFLI